MKVICLQVTCNTVFAKGYPTVLYALFDCYTNYLTLERELLI